jgi:hypothetical protein
MPADNEVIALSHGETLVDHSQIFFHDCAFDDCEADLDLLYNQESSDRHLGVAPGMLAIFTAKRYGTVPVDLIGRTGPPDNDFSRWTT